ncbi:MAG: hypothetical protein COC05_03750 [Gammaproteobacteria bacterium]|nr:MAG: hypothetical protein COC05_03750 [Gammaproteobacteria bacterium]
MSFFQQATSKEKKFLNCRICWSVALATFLAILIVEAVIFIPSYKNYGRGWQKNREAQALLATQAVLATLSDDERLSLATIATRMGALVRSEAILDWAIYPNATEDKAGHGGSSSQYLIDSEYSRMNTTAVSSDVLDVLWRHNTLGIPYDVKVRLDMEGLAPALRAFLLRILGLTAMVSFFVTAITMIVLNRQVLRPVLNLRAHLKQAGEEVGNLQALIANTGRRDELGDVMEVFNGMLLHIGENLETIKKNEGELQLAHDNLELHVQERTEALHQEVQERREIEQLLRDQESTLYQSANYDELTGLPNRLLGFDRLLQALEYAKLSGCVGALMFIDLDDFKEINDTMGHGMGDQLLRQTAERLSNALRGIDGAIHSADKKGSVLVGATSKSAREDIVARIGGDEFMVVLPEITSEEDVAVVAGRLSEACSIPFYLNHHEVFVTASIGIALFPRDGNSQQELMMSADTALYSVKGSGRNGYRFFSSEMHHRLKERMEIEAQLRYGLVNEEFMIHYQLVVDVKTKQLVGVEALLRWHNSHLGWMAPDEFIHVAEGTGLIIPIGEWVLNEACKAAKQLEIMGFPIRMALNISARQFRGAHLIDTVSKVLDEVGLSAERLELEITESLLVDDQSEVFDTINQLRKIGVRLSIDDFGTGYSALSYLRRFNVNALKIDRSFISEIENSEQDASLTRTIIAMAKNFDLEVIAEGVENQAQLDFLTLHGCDLVQGFYLGRPSSFDELVKTLQCGQVV